VKAETNTTAHHQTSIWQTRGLYSTTSNKEFPLALILQRRSTGLWTIKGSTNTMQSLEEKLRQESTFLVNRSCPCSRREGIHFTLRPLCYKERIQVPIEAKAGWMTFWRRVECLARTGNRTPGLPARSVVSIPITLPGLHQHF
jgi:hypothetical protein